MSNKLFIHFWPLIIGVTLVLYALVLILLPFNPVHSTLMLFTLLSYWSRLPGTGIKAPFFALYFLDVVDFFSLIIAINVDGVTAAIFTIFCNFVSRVGGVTPPWSSVVRAGIIQAIICLIIPYLHFAAGENLFVTMMIYTILYRIGFIIIWFFYPFPPMPTFAFLWVGITATLFIVNGTYAYFFGPFFDNILREGVKFSWPLFFFATGMIISGKIMLFGGGNKLMDVLLKRSSRIKRIKEYITKKIKNNKIYKMSTGIKNIIIKHRRDKRIRQEEQEKEISNLVLKEESQHLFTTDMSIPDPHEIVLVYFKHSNRISLTAGTISGFKTKAFLMIAGCIVLKLFASSSFPGIFQSILCLTILLVSVDGLILVIRKVNEASKQSVGRMFFMIIGLCLSMIILGILVL